MHYFGALQWWNAQDRCNLEFYRYDLSEFLNLISVAHLLYKIGEKLNKINIVV